MAAGGYSRAVPEPAAPPEPASLLELRTLDGPNLYFSRPAATVTLDVTALLDAPLSRVEAAAHAVGLSRSRPGAPGSGFRQRWAARWVARTVRAIAAAGGTSRLAVRSRPAGDLSRLVVAYPWRRRGRAEALGLALATVVDLVAAADVPDDALPAAIEEAVRDGGARVRDAPAGEPPRLVRPRIPVVAITGTNGKTTTSRLVAHIARTAGRVVGWSNTDGVWVDGVQVAEGDYSGPAGARTVLADPRVQLAVLETARGGILLRGMGIAHADVAVVTNVSADHLGLRGIDTLDQLAEVKSVVARAAAAHGWVVLNGDDPRTMAMRTTSPASAWVFSLDPESPSLRVVLNEGGRGTTVLDGALTVLARGEDPDPLLAVVDVPMTLAGLSRFNVENVLAAASAALAVGLPRSAVVDGLRTFRPDPEHNPGRMNCWSLPLPDGGAATVVVDLAHNEAGLEALLEVMAGLVQPGGAGRLALGTAGDRTPDILVALGELAGRGADDVVIVHKSEYLRGVDAVALEAAYRRGAATVGVELGPAYADELSGLQALAARARPGDVVALMCHQDRDAVNAWLADSGAHVDDPDTIRAKVLAARATP